jgi:BlaI family transcriptional regulator, penicillinase repressor
VSSSENLPRDAAFLAPLTENAAREKIAAGTVAPDGSAPESAAPEKRTPKDAAAAKAVSPRRSLLDLAPLELDCMTTLWPLGEATVREIREALAPRRARAYTTIMTIMDRLARKGIVERSKSGRAYVYRPRLTAEEARTQALAQVLDKFFGGSREALLAQLSSSAQLRS